MLHALPTPRSILFVAALAVFTALPSPALRADDAAPPKKSTSGKAAADDKAPAKETIEGTLSVNEVTCKLTHFVIYEAKFFDEVRINVLASSEPIPLEKLTESLKKDGTDDDFFHFEPHVKLTFDEKGKLSGFNAWADNTTVARSGGDDLKGNIETKEGRVTGNASQKAKEDDTFKCDFDLKFSGNLMKAPKSEDKPKSGSGKSTKKKPSSLLDFLGGSNPKSPAGKPSAKDDEGEEEEMKEEEDEDDDDEKPKKKKSSDKSFNVYELPLPKDAKNVEYKKIVNMVNYKSATSVEDLADFIVKGLKKQGWPSEDDTDLITPGSCIISREKGDVKVTIFVKPDGGGSTVTIMSEGLSWEKKKVAEEKSAPSKKPAPKADDDSEESEKEE